MFSSRPSAPFRLAVNGYGRIGRCFVRAIHEAGLADHLCVVAINEPAALASIAHLTRFDSTHGRFPGRIDIVEDKNILILDGRPASVSHAHTPGEVDWRVHEIDLLVECSGHYIERVQLQGFIDAGCPRLLLSNPGAHAHDVDTTVVHGVTHTRFGPRTRLISAASCTTNAVIPVLCLLHREFGLERVLLTTLHSAMNDQPLIDGYHHPELARTRSAMQSIIPVATGLARGVERLMPELTGRVEAKAIRVPTHNVSAIDMVLTFSKEIGASCVNDLLREAAQREYAGLLNWSDAPHASIDFNHDSHSAIVDGSQTRACGPQMVNLFVWFDNEWGFANRMVELARHWLEALANSHSTGAPITSPFS
ncbi:MAG: erythrose-4-phosphate dehydrogenase [Betaproteobacteria bacterium]|nr:erythrose-4-phosphate dehydrogenase [Betaproteobacteria bacterium]